MGQQQETEVRDQTVRNTVEIEGIKEQLIEIKAMLKDHNEGVLSKIEDLQKNVNGLKLENAGSIERFVKKNPKIILFVLAFLNPGSVSVILDILSKIKL